MTIGMVWMRYVLWACFFVLQGRAIELAILKDQWLGPILYTLSAFIVVKMLVMFSDILQKFILEHYKNRELRELWITHMPKSIYKDFEEHPSNVQVLFFDYFPRIFELEISQVANKTLVYCVFALTLAAFVSRGFFLGICALSLVFVLNYCNKNIFVKKIDAFQRDTYQSKIKILHWVDQYFSSYREISKNWPDMAHGSWKEEIYHSYFFAKKNQTAFYLYRDVVAQILTELPFLLNTSIVILGVYYDYLSVSQLFVWVGFSQFMINASNAFLENRIFRKQLATLNEEACSILDSFGSTISQKVPIPNGRGLVDSHCDLTLVMQDGTINQLSLVPGVYQIKGENGSGKSTLMNMVLGYERGSYDFNNKNFASFLNQLRPEQLRVIDREPIIFECLADFNNQICGPAKNQKRWEETIYYAISQLLSRDLAGEWMKVFISLEAEYHFRQDKSMSSGEKVVLSLMRFFSSWESKVHVLIIDECDSFLDRQKKDLFIKTVMELARHMAVYIGCHMPSLDSNAVIC